MSGSLAGTRDIVWWSSWEVGSSEAPPKSDVPVITPGELAETDGLLFGFPTRYGTMAAQFQAFIDSTGSQWRTQELVGKPAGLFYSTGSQGGGQETTPWVLISQVSHLLILLLICTNHRFTIDNINGCVKKLWKIPLN